MRHKLFRPLDLSVQDVLYFVVMLITLGVIYGTLSTRLDALSDQVQDHKSEPEQIATLIQKVDDMSADISEIKRDVHRQAEVSRLSRK